MKSLYVAILLSLFTPLTARADWDWRWHHGHDFHDHDFHAYSDARHGAAGEQAIENGIRTGQLSWREVRELRGEEREIHEKERAYLADGYLSRSERADLRDEQHDFWKDLNHELHDGERR